MTFKNGERVTILSDQNRTPFVPPEFIPSLFSLVLPFYRDLKTLCLTLQSLEQREGGCHFSEVLLCHNGPSLSASEKASLEPFLTDKCRLHHTEQAGLGAGYKLGIEKSSSPYVVLSASDLPFGTTDVESFLALEEKPQLGIGSKAHPESRSHQRAISRKLASFGFYLARRVLLGKGTPKDSQGTILVETKLAKELANLVPNQ